MTFAEVIERLARGGCRLRAEGEALVVVDPRRTLDDDLRQAIREHKASLLLLADACAVLDVALGAVTVEPLAPPEPPARWPPARPSSSRRRR